MLMEEVFSTGIMKMGPSRVDPEGLVGVFNLELVAGLPAVRNFGLAAKNLLGLK